MGFYTANYFSHFILASMLFRVRRVPRFLPVSLQLSATRYLNSDSDTELISELFGMEMAARRPGIGPSVTPELLFEVVEVMLSPDCCVCMKSSHGSLGRSSSSNIMSYMAPHFATDQNAAAIRARSVKQLVIHDHFQEIYRRAIDAQRQWGNIRAQQLSERRSTPVVL